MSGMISVGSSQSTLAYLLTKSAGRAEGTDEGKEASRQAQMDAFLDNALSAAGVDDQTATAIEEEMKSLMQASQEAGNFPPDPQSMKDAVDGIFAKYGLNAKDILGPPPGAGGRPSGPPLGPAAGSSSSDDDTQSLIDLLQQLAEKGASAEDLSKIFADAIKGLDETV